MNQCTKGPNGQDEIYKLSEVRAVTQLKSVARLTAHATSKPTVIIGSFVRSFHILLLCVLEEEQRNRLETSPWCALQSRGILEVPKEFEVAVVSWVVGLLGRFYVASLFLRHLPGWWPRPGKFKPWICQNPFLTKWSPRKGSQLTGDEHGCLSIVVPMLKIPIGDEANRSRQSRSVPRGTTRGWESCYLGSSPMAVNELGHAQQQDFVPALRPVCGSHSRRG